MFRKKLIRGPDYKNNYIPSNQLLLLIVNSRTAPKSRAYLSEIAWNNFWIHNYDYRLSVSGSYTWNAVTASIFDSWFWIKVSYCLFWLLLFANWVLQCMHRVHLRWSRQIYWSLPVAQNAKVVLSCLPLCMRRTVCQWSTTAQSLCTRNGALCNAGWDEKIRYSCPGGKHVHHCVRAPTGQAHAR
jgi:hypothetical protein